MITFQPAQADQLDAIMIIENQGFTPDEVATRMSMAERIKRISDTFIVATDNHQVLGYIVGPASNQRYIDDALYDHLEANQPTDRYQTVLSLAVSTTARKQGLGSKLLSELAKVARTQNRDAITLTCLEKLVPFYERNGYVNEGVSASTHAGETWYNMVKAL
ncbi:GNAT family N-acetyltransferase [Lactobacillus sp. LC28-10]|uniref:GNAT family N-acetyltransferase n=1 Tax=Secundilactobacillus angelensis TaxID=2722706 RepID=A0ABX1KY59_9LACO|nr:GNAT family N-acetyltransferase [Secundilactobacillus angelensis]MCH5462449.1 GNAT family N-acetyltransferase [Secundilactobacillus angelensis]NLR18069.1 GNAT family N-acetyltransferase [Secundilactobacillus angelensis]